MILCGVDGSGNDANGDDHSERDDGNGNDEESMVRSSGDDGRSNGGNDDNPNGERRTRTTRTKMGANERR